MTTSPGVANAAMRSERQREVVRGASAETLERPAGAYLASLRWGGTRHDPDTLSAGDFLARL